MENQEKVLTIDLRINRRVTLIMIAVMITTAVLGYFVLQYQQANASTSQAVSSVSGLRKFYLTKSFYQGDTADGSDGNGAGVCAAGYHFASLWEIQDTTRLEYNSVLGVSWEEAMGFPSDAGKGPPSDLVGWIRTGFYSNGSSGTWGYDNCSVWTSKSSSDEGAVVYLQAQWSNAGNTFGWSGSNWDCDVVNARVWCVEN